MQRLTPAQQASVVSFAKGLKKVKRSRSSETATDSKAQVKKTTPMKWIKKQGNENAVNAVDGRTPLATRLAHEPAAPVKWILAPPLSAKERTSTKRRYYDDGTGVRVFQGGLCNGK